MFFFLQIKKKNAARRKTTTKSIHTRRKINEKWIEKGKFDWACVFGNEYLSLQFMKFVVSLPFKCHSLKGGLLNLFFFAHNSFRSSRTFFFCSLLFIYCFIRTSLIDLCIGVGLLRVLFTLQFYFYEYMRRNKIVIKNVYFSKWNKMRMYFFRGWVDCLGAHYDRMFVFVIIFSL